MFKHTFLLTILFLTFSLQAQKSTELVFNETTVKLSVENQKWFTKTEGSASGKEYLQKMGKLRDIIELVDDTTNMRISPRLEKKLWKIEAKGPEAKNLRPYLSKILNEYAKLESFEMTYEEDPIEFLKATVSDTSKLTKHLNTMVGISSMSSLTPKSIRIIDTAENILKILEKEVFSPEVLMISSELNSSQLLDIQLDRESSKQIIKDLEEIYGIKIEKFTQKMRFITID